MRFFIDTAKVEDIKKANDMGVICGVTTNPSLIAKEGRDFKEVIKEITSIVDGPISGEVKATTVDADIKVFLCFMLLCSIIYVFLHIQNISLMEKNRNAAR